MEEKRIKNLKDRLKGLNWLAIVGFSIAFLYVSDVSYDWGKQNGFSQAKTSCKELAYYKIAANEVTREKEAFGLGDKKTYNVDVFVGEVLEKENRIKEDPKIKEFVADICAF